MAAVGGAAGRSAPPPASPLCREQLRAIYNKPHRQQGARYDRFPYGWNENVRGNLLSKQWTPLCLFQDFSDLKSLKIFLKLRKLKETKS